jgi:hypothetical protein
MNEFFTTFLNQYGMEIIATCLTAIASYIGLCVKNAYTKYIDTKTKKEVVDIVVKATEQLYKTLDGEAKLNVAIEDASAMLANKGIVCSDLELRLLIEATVNSFKNAK